MITAKTTRFERYRLGGADARDHFVLKGLCLFACGPHPAATSGNTTAEPKIDGEFRTNLGIMAAACGVTATGLC